VFRLVSLNLNGIRSAASKGFVEWAQGVDADCMGVQEVRAQQPDVAGRFDRLFSSIAADSGIAGREAFAPALRGPLRRDELFVVSKVYPHHAGTQDAVAACERSLRRLRLDHLDLYLLHWRGAVPMHETLRGFEQLQARGLIRHWGVSNFDLDDLQELQAVPGGMACAANQVWYSLGRRGVEFDLLPWQVQRQVPLMAYSPIDQGALAEHTGLAALAVRLGRTPGQLALAWTLARPGVVSIPKSSDPLRLRQNLEAARWTLSAEDLAALDRLFPPPRRKQALAVG